MSAPVGATKPKGNIGGGSLVRKPEWLTPVAGSDEQAETAVVAVLDDPPRVGWLSSGMRLQLFTADGRNLGFAPEILGVIEVNLRKVVVKWL